MAEICPTVLAESVVEFNAQLARVSKFADRIQVDLMDGEFAQPKSVDLNDIWLPPTKQIDIHLMYQRPMDYIDKIIKLRPSLVIVHAEAHVHHMHFAAELHKYGIDSGLAVLPETPIVNVEQILNSFDHLLIFGGKLGSFGGKADLEQLHKIKQAKEHHPDLEFGWDGGANADNAEKLVEEGVDVVNVGGFIQKADDPKAAYEKLIEVIR